MNNKEGLEALAAQLRRPHGVKGIEVADMMHATNSNMTHHAIDQLDLRDGDLILELGHGNCGHLPYLMKQKSKLSYYGLELSASMKAEAERINETFVAKKQAAFHLYDGRHIPFADNFFDRILTVNTIYFWQDPKLLLSELYRVTKHGGLLNITFAQKSFMQQLPFTQFGFVLYDKEKITQLVATSPFTSIRLVSETETITSKAGDVIDREFTTITLKK